MEMKNKYTGHKHYRFEDVDGDDLDDYGWENGCGDRSDEDYDNELDLLDWDDEWFPDHPMK
jgi:hypothetical protein